MTKQKKITALKRLLKAVDNPEEFNGFLCCTAQTLIWDGVFTYNESQYLINLIEENRPYDAIGDYAYWKKYQKLPRKKYLQQLINKVENAKNSDH